MENTVFDIPVNLEVHPRGDNGEMEILPATGKSLLSSSVSILFIFNEFLFPKSVMIFHM